MLLVLLLLAAEGNAGFTFLFGLLAGFCFGLGAFMSEFFAGEFDVGTSLCFFLFESGLRFGSGSLE